MAGRPRWRSGRASSVLSGTSSSPSARASSPAWPYCSASSSPSWRSRAGASRGRYVRSPAGLPADLPERRHLEVILRQTGRIAEIIRALLDYTRPRRPDRRPQAVVPLLARVADVLAGRIRPKGLRLRLDLPWDLPPVLGDGD